MLLLALALPRSRQLVRSNHGLRVAARNILSPEKDKQCELFP